jgi:transposase
MSLDEVDDIEVLRRAAKILESENQAMAKMIAKLKRELHELKGGDPEQLRLQIAELEEQLSRRNKALFGDSSEKRRRPKKKSPDDKQRGHGRREQPELPLEEQIHVADVSAERCDLCGGGLSEWSGQFAESEEVEILERRFVLKKIRRQKYKCECGSCIKTAPGPLKLFDGARYSVGFAVHVAMAKYGDHLPLERQVRGMKRDGLLVDSQTLWDQLERLARLLEPVYERLESHVLSQPVIGVDETHWKMLTGKGKKQGGGGKRWQVWAKAAADAVHYRIEDSRSADAGEKVLGDYAGVAITDGYAVYETLKKRGGRFTQANCWSHVRRKFVEVEEQHPGSSAEVLELIGQLYGVEEEARGRPPDEVLELRREKSKPIVFAIQSWTYEQEALPQSGLRKAIQYMGGVWEGLQVFLENPNVDLDNNRTERALRGVVLGRKNHYGSKSRRGTEVSALLYSLIESAKLAGAGPHTYLMTAVNAALRGQRIPLPHEML